MNPVVMKSRVGPGGLVSLSVNVGAAETNREVQVTIEPVAEQAPALTKDEWAAFIRRTAGSIPDPAFRRHEQGVHEIRAELP